MKHRTRFCFVSIIAGLGLGFALAGCEVGPTFHPAVPDQPLAKWGAEPRDNASLTSSGEVDGRWWIRFRDPELTSLVGRVVDDDLDLKTAAERVVQGTEQRQVTASQALPHLDGVSQTTATRMSPNGFLRLVQSAPNAPLDYTIFNDGLSASWQLDLFGRVSRAIEAADADTLASVEARHGIALAGIAEMAQDYLTLRGVQLRIRIARDNLALAESNVTLVETQFSNGVANTLELAQARAQRATIAATLPPLATQQAQLINAMGLLLGLPPRGLESELAAPKGLPRVPSIVPVGLPGALVRRRPDVREMEAQLHAATAQTGVAVASFYPDVTLFGSLSTNSLSAASLFIPASTAYTAGPTVTIPLFEGGRLRGTLALRESQQREAAVEFQQVVLRAWREVDDALTAYAQAQRRRVDLSKAVVENKAALAAARQRYGQGVIDFLNVISTETTLLQSENDLADLDTQIAVTLVRLYRALGGGWEIAESPASAQQSVEAESLEISSPLCGGRCPDGLAP